MNRPHLLIGILLVLLLMGIEIVRRESNTWECYFRETRSSVLLLAEKERVWEACVCNFRKFPFC